MTTVQSKLAIDGGPKVRTKPWPGRGSIGQEEKAAVDALFDEAIAGQQPITYNGPREEEYCKEFASHMGGGYADAVSSGSAAVYVSLRALDPQPFSEIIVSPITDASGMMPIAMLGCIPVIADTAVGSFNTGPAQIEPMISPLTRAIVVAHIGGEAVDMVGIMALARKHGIPVIEDCAQAHGAKLNDKFVGSFGEIAAFSTMFSKHYCTGGQGGIVYTRDENIYKEIRRASDRGKPFGLPEGSTNCIATLNFNMDEISAAIGCEQLKKLPEIVRGRREIVATIDKGLKSLNAVSIPEVVPGSEPSYWFLRLRFHAEAVRCDKFTFCKALEAEGLQIDPNYNLLPHTFDWYTRRRVFGNSGYPWTSPAYKGDPKREFICPNARKSIANHFIVYTHQNWGDEEISDALEILTKVERAYQG